MSINTRLICRFNGNSQFIIAYSQAIILAQEVTDLVIDGLINISRFAYRLSCLLIYYLQWSVPVVPVFRSIIGHRQALVALVPFTVCKSINRIR